MPAIELEGVERRYGERVALAGVAARVDEGQTLAVLGANGAGKTTLLRVLAALLRPHGGHARVLGAELPKEAWKVHGKVGLLGHEPLLYRELSGRENLRYHARLHGVREERVGELLGAVGMERRADEPRSHLDPAGVELLEPLIGRPSGRTRVLVTHDVEAGVREADLALGLRGGRQAFCVPAAELDGRTARELYA